MLKSALILAAVSTLCMAAPTRRAVDPSGPNEIGQFPVQVKTFGEKFIYSLDLKGDKVVNTDILYFSPGPSGCFEDTGGQVTTDGVNSLPFAFQVYTSSLLAANLTAPTCYVAGCLPNPLPDGGIAPLVFDIVDNGNATDYLFPCGSPPGWNGVSVRCEGPLAACSAGILSSN